MRPLKIQIRLRKCAVWSESSLGAHIRKRHTIITLFAALSAITQAYFTWSLEYFTSDDKNTIYVYVVKGLDY